jgi:uncharacterized membrane protein
VQYVDQDALLDALPSGAIARLHVAVGGFATQHAPLCSLWCIPDDADALPEDVRRSIHIGRTRTIAQDPAYGIRQIADVALRALSPGVNDPTTAHDAMLHLGAVLTEAYRRQPPPETRCGDRGQALHEPAIPGHSELTALAFDELRRVAAGHPRVAVDLLHIMAVLCAADHGCRDCIDDLQRHGRRVVEECERIGMHPSDMDDVRRAHGELQRARSSFSSAST